MRWAKRIGFILVSTLVLLSSAGFAFEQWERRTAWARFAPPGKMVDVDGVSSHLYCTGTGSPTVVLVSGLDTEGSLGWSGVQPKIAEFTRVCSYDRAGIMWSAARAGTRDASAISNELQALLAKAAEAPPFVMVGHSLGGLLVRVFTAATDPDVVKGMVLVDSSHPEQLTRAPAPDGGPPPAWLIDVLANLGVIRVGEAGTASPKLPEDARQRIEAFAPQSVAAVVAELRAVEATLRQARGTGPIGDRPLVVLTAGDKPPEMRVPWLELQAELVALSTNSDHRLLAASGHSIQQEHPDAVVSAVRDVVIAVREQAPVRRAIP